jgi:hypothetical protein
MDLSAFQGNATNVAFTTLGSSDIAEGFRFQQCTA